MDSERDRLLGAARALGLPVPDTLADAPLADVRRVVRALASSALDETDRRLGDLKRERATLAALLYPLPPGHA